ncbi:MAG: F0F1 ATP synthase subunit epsilon [bacterium]
MARDEKIESSPDLKTMAMPTEFDLLIVNMDKVVFEGKAKTLIAPGPYGDFAILPGHGPMYTTLGKGKIVVETIDGKEEYEVESGIAKVNQLKVTLLVGF